MITCAWCTSDQSSPRYPGCDCRDLCPASQCLPSFPAAEVTPGMALHHPHGGDVFDVLTVTGPDAQDFMHLTSPHEQVQVAADWHVTEYTRQDAELAAFLLLAESNRSTS